MTKHLDAPPARPALSPASHRAMGLAVATALTTVLALGSPTAWSQATNGKKAATKKARTGPRTATLDLSLVDSRLTQGLPNGNGFNARGVWEFANGDVARAEWLKERKFGATGGIVALGYTRVLSPDWILSGTVAAGHGGPNWANRRADIELTTKWGEQRALLTNVAIYHASYDGNRSDRGLRLGVVGYLPGSVVLEGGATFNTSQPGKVRSTMPFVSATWGSDGDQYISARYSHGSEAYQALAGNATVVDFRSSSLGLTWRRWLADDWGVTAQAEYYRNRSSSAYNRTTIGGGVFAEW